MIGWGFFVWLTGVIGVVQAGHDLGAIALGWSLAGILLMGVGLTKEMMK